MRNEFPRTPERQNVLHTHKTGTERALDKQENSSLGRLGNPSTLTLGPFHILVSHPYQWTENDLPMGEPPRLLLVIPADPSVSLIFEPRITTDRERKRKHRAS